MIKTPLKKHFVKNWVLFKKKIRLLGFNISEIMLYYFFNVIIIFKIIKDLKKNIKYNLKIILKIKFGKYLF